MIAQALTSCVIQGTVNQAVRSLSFPEGSERETQTQQVRRNMKSKLIALASVATIALTAAAIPNQAEANWRGHRHGGWWGPGAVIGGLALGAAVASRPYFDYGYAYDPGPYAYDYDYGPAVTYEYGGPYAYDGPRYYRGGYGYPYRHWREFGGVVTTPPLSL